MYFISPEFRIVIETYFHTSSEIKNYSNRPRHYNVYSLNVLE
jgi:hypothetical protein